MKHLDYTDYLNDVLESIRDYHLYRRLSALLNCRVSLSPEMAVRIAKATKTSPESWLYMQAKLDLWIAIKKLPKVKELKIMAV